MAKFSFLTFLTATLGANGTGTLSMSVPEGETRTITQILQESTGAFSITGIRDSNGRNYSNATPGSPLPGVFIADVDDGFNGNQDLPEPIVIQGNVDFLIDIVDTSGAGNTINLMLTTVRDDRST